MLNALIRDIKLPDRMNKLPISDRGFPIPWFIHIDDDGVPNFTAVHPGRIAKAHNQKRCWICGEPLGVYLCFTMGPMCVVNRTNAEPPSHYECAAYAAQACPFLINPNAKRNAKALPEEHIPAPGEMILRNPGVTALYVTKRYKLFKVHNGALFNPGEPERVEWWCRGRTASRAEVDASINSGLPLLYEQADRDHDPKEARQVLDAYITRVQSLLPA
jgi:hypothetical protein